MNTTEKGTAPTTAAPTTAAPTKVALLVTCLVDQFFPRVGEASLRLLEAAGCDVEVPLGQTCCGQPAFNTGYRDEARRLLRRWVDVFEPYDNVVAPSGSCVSMSRVFYRELMRESDDDKELLQRWQALAERTFELTEFLAQRDFQPSSSFRGKVAYHASCHLLRELGVDRAPLTLLRQVPGVELVELADAEVCCGFGGSFSFKMPELSGAMLDAKLDAVAASGADFVTATDCGCLMHLGGALSRRAEGVQTRHIAEILAWEDTDASHP